MRGKVVLSDESKHPTLVFHISPIYNLFHYLRKLSGKAMGEQSALLAQAFQEMMALRHYSPGSGMWGYFEEVFAASQGTSDLEERLDVACQRLQATLLGLVDQALPLFEEEWQRWQASLFRRRNELMAIWYPREKTLMQMIEDTFATPWEGPDAKEIEVHLLYDPAHAAKSRPLTLGVDSQPLDLLLCDIVHELLHRNTFGPAKNGLWARLRLYYFTAGVPAWLGQEVTHAVITWAAWAISAQVWDLDFDLVYHSFYDETTDLRRRSLDVMAKLWPAYQAGQLKTKAFVRQAVDSIQAAANGVPVGRQLC